MVVLAAGVLYLTHVTTLYTSTAHVYVEQRGPRIIQETQPGVMTASMNYLYTQVELMTALSVVSEAIADCDAEGLRLLANVENPIEFLQEHLDVSVGRQDDIIRVSLQSPYPVENARVVNAVVDAYMSFHSARKQSTSAEVLRILQKEKVAQEEILSERLRALTQFRKDHPDLPFQSGAKNTAQERFERLSAALTEAQLATLEAQSNHELAEQMADDPAGFIRLMEALATMTPGTLPPDNTTVLEARLQELKNRRTRHHGVVTTQHPSITALDAEIAWVEDQIDTVERKFVASQMVVLKQQYLTAKEKEQQLATRLEQQHQLTTDLNQVMAEFAILESAYEGTKRVYDVLDDRMREVDVAEDAGALNIVVMETARPALTPTAPQKARVMAIALVLGLMLGGSAAVLREMTDQRLQSAEEVTSWLGLPHLGLLPSISGWSFRRRARKTATAPSSSVAEAFRSIRTGLYLGASAEQSRIIQVTSSLPGEGTSTVVSNLGISMAQSGQTVLIVDANLRRPVQHKVFAATRETGLTSVLKRAEQLDRAIVSTSTPGLFLLPAGPEVVVPAEVLSGMFFEAVLAEMAQHFDRILLDTPAMRPTADARIVAARSHAVILVMRRGICTYPALRHAYGLLRQDASHVIGSVGNGFRESRNAHWIHAQPDARTRGNGEQWRRLPAAALPVDRVTTSPFVQVREQVDRGVVRDGARV